MVTYAISNYYDSMKGSRLYIDMLKVFRDVVETKSFSEAANRNYITQSAVSQQIAFIERLFGKKMIIRGKGKFSLTTEGRVFLNGCVDILDIYQKTLDNMQMNVGEITETINIETVYSLGFYHLPSLIKSFMNRHKNINLHIEYNRSDRIYTDVIKGVCDFGIVAYPWEQPLVNITYGMNEELVFVCSPSDNLSHLKKISLKKMNNKDFIAFIKEIPTRDAIDKIFKKENVSVNIKQEFDNIETLKRSVELGTGVSVLPKNTIQQEVKNNSLVAIPISGNQYFRTTGIITRKDRPLSRATEEVIHWITDEDARQ